MITLKIDDRQWRRDLKNFKRKSEFDFQNAITRATLTLVKLAILKVKDFTVNSKVKHAWLENNIKPVISNKKLTGTVYSLMNYSQAFEEGTRPHPIEVVNKKVLAGPYQGRPAGWIVSKKSESMGYATYGKKVPRHPGTKPHPYMFPAFKSACDYLEKKIREALK